ncbi:hypothetical protein D9615_002207 [Tricholomella constricta]|uniref:Calpain catalytic domain-containing protein n=1 Tax=Tricholomella constricta TaxID=117010 RepID=A0A8H5HMK6_9AGAR|nr:hypothetical protein D9615_002207 [Tricholomella constricta]
MTRSKQQRARKARLERATKDRPQPGQASFVQQQKRGGLLVTDELNKALEECKSRVAQIAENCRGRNRKFRDIEFDLQNDRHRCLQGLQTDRIYSPSDVQRATQIFEKPSFFIDGADSNDIIQGSLGDCWFLSALATMSTAKGLVEKFCVARDEQIGVYGFIFFRDTAWVVVIIDDLLFTSIPKFEELSISEKQLYHYDKETFNKSARRGSKSLYFAQSGTDGETWVPLIEKAYAKLHGNYAALRGGETGEAVEDLTGGVTSFIFTQDILDPDRFWNDELLRANEDRLFACAYDTIDSYRSGNINTTVNGLIGGHAYAVLRAVEYNGKRFVVIRNPWGRNEWMGPWSDGSKEWTPEWIPALSVLGHSFGDDGRFIMEYKDFLENWEQIDRTLLFDSSWAMSSQWLKVTSRLCSQLGDSATFHPISGRSRWSFDFVVFRKGETEPITTSSLSPTSARSVNAEMFLDSGEYVVHVRLDRHVCRPSSYLEAGPENWQERTYSRVLMERAKSRSIASNFDRSAEAKYLSVSLDTLAGQDLAEIEAKAAAASEAWKKEKELEEKPTADEEVYEHVVEQTPAPAPGGEEKIFGGLDEEAEQKGDTAAENDDGDEDDGDSEDGSKVANDKDNHGEGDHENRDGAPTEKDDSRPPRVSDPSEDDVIFLGLRVYTKKESPVKVEGQLRHNLEATSFAGLSIDDW